MPGGGAGTAYTSVRVWAAPSPIPRDLAGCRQLPTLTASPYFLLCESSQAAPAVLEVEPASLPSPPEL